MGWSIYLVEPVTREVIVLPFKHQMFGSTYCVGGTDELWIDITYNYDKIYREKTNGLSLDYLHNKFAYETIEFLENLINSLGDDVSDNYWDATEGNAKKVLFCLLTFARMRPDGIWDVS